jgi:hypothetical protein
MSTYHGPVKDANYEHPFRAKNFSEQVYSEKGFIPFPNPERALVSQGRGGGSEIVPIRIH